MRGVERREGAEQDVDEWEEDDKTTCLWNRKNQFSIFLSTNIDKSIKLRSISV